MSKSNGQVRYEADVKARPTYHDGKPRKAWDRLGDVERWSWEKQPRSAIDFVPHDSRAGEVFLYVDGAYHCTCDNMQHAKAVAAERFGCAP